MKFCGGLQAHNVRFPGERADFFFPLVPKSDEPHTGSFRPWSIDCAP